MTTKSAALLEPDLVEPVEREVEYPVYLTHLREPVLCLAGKVGVIRSGRRDLALSAAEWQDLGLPELVASAELNGAEDSADDA